MFKKNSQKNFKSKGPELLQDLADQCAQALTDLLGLEKEKAEQIGREIAERMASHWGGQNIYFPMGLTMHLSQRDQEVYEAFTGDNHGDLARQFGVSVQWVYRILKLKKAEDLAERQNPLFPQ
jgi:Mor family transcriptional regulator